MSVLRWMALSTMIAACTWAQTAPDDVPRNQRVKHRNAQQSPGRQVAGGAGNIGTGAAKGAGHLAAGTGKGALDLVTLHPIDAGVSVGHGAVSAGKDIGVGTVKGTTRMTKGVGRAIRHIL